MRGCQRKSFIIHWGGAWKERVPENISHYSLGRWLEGEDARKYLIIHWGRCLEGQGAREYLSSFIGEVPGRRGSQRISLIIHWGGGWKERVPENISLFIGGGAWKERVPENISLFIGGDAWKERVPDNISHHSLGRCLEGEGAREYLSLFIGGGVWNERRPENLIIHGGRCQGGGATQKATIFPFQLKNL